MSKSYFNMEIPLVAGVKKQVDCGEVTSFVMNTGTGVIRCKVPGKNFRIREAQVQDHSDEPIKKMELVSDVNQTVDIRFGTGGMIVGPPQKEYVNVAGQLVTTMDPADLATIGQEVAHRNRSSSVADYEDVSIPTGGVTTLIGADTTIRETVVQRVDSHELECRIGGAPGASKGIKMLKDDIRVISGGGALKVFNESGETLIFAISREVI